MWPKWLVIDNMVAEPLKEPKSGEEPWASGSHTEECKWVSLCYSNGGKWGQDPIWGIRKGFSEEGSFLEASRVSSVY